MTITLNGELKTFSEGTTVAELLASLSIPGGRSACEINGEVVRRAEYGARALREQDVVEIVQMIGGG